MVWYLVGELMLFQAERTVTATVLASPVRSTMAKLFSVTLHGTRAVFSARDGKSLGKETGEGNRDAAGRKQGRS
jgi:hypothetical protein